MKKILVALFVIVGLNLFAQQAKKPTLMILPSDNWCTQRYFYTSYNNHGTDVRVINYRQAFQEDIELPQVISKIGAVLTDMGYSVKDAEQELKNIEVREAEDFATNSSTTGAALEETTLDILKRRIKSDVVIQIWWQAHSDNTVSFTIEAFDAYTSKRIATSTGTAKNKDKNISLTLESSVKKNIKDFDKQLCRWFDDQIKNGREIVLTIRCWDNWDGSLESEYSGEELIDCIQGWLRENTVNSAFNLSDMTETTAQFEQVRIPMEANGRSIDARDFATSLRKYLQKPPYNITSKVMVRGLGEAIIVLGEK